MICPHCGKEHPDDASYCPVTGRTLIPQSSKCRQCGANLPPEVSFCTECGTPVAGSISEANSTRRKPFFLWLSILVFISLIILLGIYSWNQHWFSDIPVTPTQPITNIVSKAVVVSLTQKPTVTLKATHPPKPSQAPTSVPTVEEININPKDQAEIVFVSSGEFLMGSDPDKDPYFWGAEAPEHTVFLDSYWIYRFEVTQGMYQECVTQKACPLPLMINHPVAKQYGDPRFANYPVVMVDWVSALAYCQWAGARLPTEAEWEKADRGIDGRLFPWGNDPDANDRANFSSSSPVEVGSFPLGQSPFGAYDMAGNVLEWVNDSFGALYYEISPYENPQGPSSSNRKVIRGGAFNHSEVAGLRTVARASLNSSDTKISVGFRCVLNTP